MLPSLQYHQHLETTNVHFNVDIQLGTHANIANMKLEHFGYKLLIYHSIIPRSAEDNFSTSERGKRMFALLYQTWHGVDVDNSDGRTIELLQRRQWLGSVDIERCVSLHLILMPCVSSKEQETLEEEIWCLDVSTGNFSIPREGL